MTPGWIALATAAVLAAHASAGQSPDAAARSADAPAQSPDSSVRISCQAAEDVDRRVYVLDAEDGAWRLSFRSVATGDQWLRLALPGAQPSLDGGTARLSYRNANGGRQIDLVVTPERSSLDVWVDYGLDVNIEPDLDPRVDLMNTDGPLVATCAVESSR